MRPEILAVVNISSQVAKENFQKEYIKTINVLLKHIGKHPRSGLRYISLEKDISYLWQAKKIRLTSWTTQAISHEIKGTKICARSRNIWLV